MWRGFNNRSALETSLQGSRADGQLLVPIKRPIWPAGGPLGWKREMPATAAVRMESGGQESSQGERGGDTSEMWSRHTRPPPVPQTRRKWLCPSPGRAPAEGRPHHAGKGWGWGLGRGRVRSVDRHSGRHVAPPAPGPSPETGLESCQRSRDDEIIGTRDTMRSSGNSC